MRLLSNNRESVLIECVLCNATSFLLLHLRFISHVSSISKSQWHSISIAAAVAQKKTSVKSQKQNIRMKNQLIWMHFNRQRVSMIYTETIERGKQESKRFQFSWQFWIENRSRIKRYNDCIEYLIAVEISHNIIEMSNHDKQMITNRSNNGNPFQFI